MKAADASAGAGGEGTERTYGSGGHTADVKSPLRMFEARWLTLGRARWLFVVGWMTMGVAAFPAARIWGKTCQV